MSRHALIVCNGKAPGKRLLSKWLSTTDLVIAADGGAKSLLRAGVRPDFIIGDMDSFIPASPNNLIIIHDADQETNDLEKALNLAKKIGAERAVVLGATGQRTDHTLKNLSVLQQYSAVFSSVMMMDSSLEYRVIPFEYSFKTKPGKLVSLYPLSGRVDGITTQGLKYPLNDEFLENGLRDGSSNEATEKTVTITYKSGHLLLMKAHG